jgi:hypothetical protein
MVCPTPTECWFSKTTMAMRIEKVISLIFTENYKNYTHGQKWKRTNM